MLQLLGTTFVGAGVGFATWLTWRMLRTDDVDQDDQWRYDVSRINELRKQSFIFRTFQPLIQFLARINRQLFPDSIPEVTREIHAAGHCRYWTGGEYLGRIEVIAMFLFPLYLYFCLGMAGAAGIVMAIVMTILTGIYLRRRLSFQARYRLLMIKRRMPFLLDLLTLLMEAGSTFLQALREAVNEYQDHPVGVEFGRVLGEMSMGKTRTEAFEAMRQRLSDDEITAIIGAIVQGENLGTPLARIFRTQADVLRIKRTQRAETLAGEAGVKMLMPAVLVMAATVIIILGPFLLRFISSELMD